MILLDSITKKFEVATSEPISLPYNALDYSCSYVVNTQHNHVTPGPICQTGYLDDTFREILPQTTQDFTHHNIKNVFVINTDNIEHILIFRVNDNGNARIIYRCTLGIGEFVAYSDELGWTIYDVYGKKKDDAITETYPDQSSDLSLITAFQTMYNF